MQEALEEVQKEASEFKTVEKKKKKKDKKVRCEVGTWLYEPAQILVT